MASRATHSSTQATRPDPGAPSRPATASRRIRAAGLVTLAGVLTLVAACSSSPSAMASMTSEVRQPAATSELPATDPGTEDGVPDLGDLEDLEDELGAQFDDLTEGLDDLSDCAALGLAYGELVVIAFTAEDPGPEIDAVIKEVQDRIPDELQDELRIVADTLTEAGAGGLLDATGALSDPAFAQANEAISNWIGAQCAGG